MTDTAVVEERTEPSWSSPERLAALVFAVAMVVAFVMYMVIGKRNWFFLDEWDFLATRNLSSDSLLEPHNEHWSTLPIVAYRIMWRLFGLRTYLPYLAMVVTLHVTAAALLRAVMRRAGVHPWLATAGAGMFLFLGSGYQNIVWAFQIGFVGSLVCGLAHLLLADHEGGLDWRDGAGLAFGLAGLMCSGVSVTMVGVVGLAVLIRRGWKLALVHTVPLAVVFGLWYQGYGSDSYNTERPSLGTLLDFVRTTLTHALRSITHFDLLAVVLLLLMVAGGVLAFVDRRRDGAAMPAGPWALAAGAVAFACITGTGRAAVLGVEGATPSRYVHLLGAMLLPAVAVGAQAVAARWRYTLPLLAVALIAGIPANIADVAKSDTINERLLESNPALIKTLPTVEMAHQVPGRTMPDRMLLIDVTIGWLLDGHRSGRIPDPAHSDARVEGVARTRLTVEQVAVPRKPPRDCRPIDPKQTIPLPKGEVVRIDGGNATIQLVTPKPKGPQALYARLQISGLVARVDDVTVRIRAAGLGERRICR